MFFAVPFAAASVVASVDLHLPGGGEAAFSRDTSELPATHLTTIDDNLGRTWQVLADIDDLGDVACVVLDVRVRQDGRELAHYRPTLLVPMGTDVSGNSGGVLPLGLTVHVERTDTTAPHALERSTFGDPGKGTWTIRTWWPGAQVECWDPAVQAVQDGEWLEFRIHRHVGAGQSSFTQCEVDGTALDLYLYRN